MKTENSIQIDAPLDRIVELAGDVERWPEILPHYRWVRLLEGGGDRKVVEMAARRDRFPVKWRAIQTIERDGATPVIRYRHIGGVTKGMEVAWMFDQNTTGYLVTIDHELRLGWPIIGGVVGDRIIGPYFVSYIAGMTLATIKELAESMSV
jgi:uncharacterized membrane protein